MHGSLYLFFLNGPLGALRCDEILTFVGIEGGVWFADPFRNGAEVCGVEPQHQNAFQGGSRFFQ